MELRGVTALVTGGARRVGKAIALGLAESGCNLVLHYNRSADEAEATAVEARAFGVRVRAVGADLSSDAVRAIADAEDLAPVRVLVNSAAVFTEDTLRRVDREAFEQTLAVNLTAPILLTSAFAAALPEGVSGAVVNVTDWRVARPYRDHFSYSVAKGGLDTFTTAAAEALAPSIRVNAVALGAILPPAGKGSAYLKALAKDIPVHHVGDTDVVVHAVRFLLENDFVTGEIVRIDGGAHLR
ncbi:MAG TPA: SDR family oxidoreductase [Acidimicrobiia bacterium]|nr:SDR family oxidoreductase [Acidimicrobiia bacterium]